MEAKKRFRDVAKRKDAAQSAVLHLMSRPPKYDPTKGAAVKTLIYTVVQRHVREYVGCEFRHRKQFMQPEPVNTEELGGAFDPLDHSENRRVKLQPKHWNTDYILGNHRQRGEPRPRPAGHRVRREPATASVVAAYHLTAEYRIRTEERGRTVDEWKLRPERPDNHWLDCLVGVAVAASIEGISMGEAISYAPQRRKVVIPEYMRRG